MDAPETLYARSGDVNIAYQVVGEGEFDLVYVPGWVSNVEYMWMYPRFTHFLQRLASFSRLILFDKRGTGLSDQVAARPPADARATDGRRARGARRGRLRAGSALRPLRGRLHVHALRRDVPRARASRSSCSRLYAKRLQSHDYPWAPTAEAREADAREIEENGWSRRSTWASIAPS